MVGEGHHIISNPGAALMCALWSLLAEENTEPGGSGPAPGPQPPRAGARVLPFPPASPSTCVLSPFPPFFFATL